MRADLLSIHLQTNESGLQLRARVNELLRAPSNKTGLAGAEDSEDFDPYDPTHLFWDQSNSSGLLCGRFAART